jgi:hypothetical protein
MNTAMTNKPMQYFFCFIMVVFVSVPSIAQEYRLDLNLRGNANATLDEQYTNKETGHYYERSLSVPDIGGSAELLYYPKGFVGVGVYYSRTVMPGEYAYYTPLSYFSPEDFSEYKYAMYGVSAQLTTSRKKRFRVYAVGRVGRVQMVEDFGDFTMGSKGFAYGAGFGVMLKLSRRISFNIFEANYIWLPKEFTLENNEPISVLQAQSGFTVKLWRVK